MEAGQVERSFGQLLTTAGLASLHFSKDVTIEDFTRLVRAFTVAGSKAQDVAKQIKEALSGGGKQSTIKINEVKFVAADPLTGDISVAAQIAAQTLGPEFKQWLNDPQKLLQLIAAAEGANSRAEVSPAALFRSEAFRTCPAMGRGAGTRNRHCDGDCASLGRWSGPAAGGRGGSGHPSADSIRPGAGGSECSSGRLAERTGRGRPQHAVEPATVAGKPGGEGDRTNNRKTRRC